MAVTYISDLPAASALAGTEVFPGDQSAATKKITANQLRQYINKSNGLFNILDYGAVQDSTTDNAASIQAAIDDAILFRGKVIVPCGVSNFNYFRIDSGLEILATAFPNDQHYLSIEGYGRTVQIQYHGANNGSVIAIAGMRGGQIHNLKLSIATGITGCTGFDIGTNEFGTTGNFSFYDCHVGLNNGVDNTGFRTGIYSVGGNGDVSFVNFYSCQVWGGQSYGYSGQYGWEIGGQNALQFGFHSCGIFLCDRGLFINDGGRWEGGHRFLDITWAGRPSCVRLANIEFGGYTFSEGSTLIQSGQNCTLIIDSLMVYRGAGLTYTDPMIILYADHDSIGNCHIRGGQYQTSSSTLVTVTYPSKWHINLKRVGKYNTNLETTTYFADIDN